MASPEAIAALRLLIGEPENAPPYTDQVLSDILDAAAGSQDQAAYNVWLQKAASAATLVDMSEGGSSRKMSDIQKQYLAMAGTFAGRLPNEDSGEGRGTRVSRLRR